MEIIFKVNTDSPQQREEAYALMNAVDLWLVIHKLLNNEETARITGELLEARGINPDRMPS